MKKSILMCLLLIGSLALNTVIAAVTVTVKQQQYVFAHEPSLVEVLAPIANHKNWYWPAVALYQADDTKLENIRISLLNNLSTLANRYKTDEPEIAKSLEQLQTAIASWRLARRLSIPIDYDLARIVAAVNPRISKGQYILNLTPRMDTVQLFGAVNNSGDMTHLGHADISEYITSHTRGDLANKDYVMLIQADGREVKAPVAYWNKAHQGVMPGSQIFVPFKESFFYPEWSTVNQQIMTLAPNRVWQ